MRGWLGTTMVIAGLATSGCAMEPATADDVNGTESDLLSLGAPTTLTLWADDFAGVRSVTTLGDSTTNEAMRAIDLTAIRAAHLENRISSFDLACGGRNAQVVLFPDLNVGTSLSTWSPFSVGEISECTAGQTIHVVLDRTLADRVASVFLVRQTTFAAPFNLGLLIEGNWTTALAAVDGAEASGPPVFTIRNAGTFDVEQELELDSWECEERSASFIVRAVMDTSGTWTATFVSRYVDTGVGDYWGCRTEMENQLEDGAVDAAHQLAAALNQLMVPLRTHPRRYLIPGATLHDVSMVTGGESDVRIAPMPPPGREI